MTFGFSRDDAAKFLGAYYENKIYEFDPFAKLDQVGVGRMIEMAVTLGRKTRPDIKLGICGEHGGDPSSIEFCHKMGLNYVSCSPFRVPIARLTRSRVAINERTRSKVYRKRSRSRMGRLRMLTKSTDCQSVEKACKPRSKLASKGAYMDVSDRRMQV